jgi:hypothetical protein
MESVSADLTDDYIAKVRLLEETVGARASYLFLDPFQVKPHDAVHVQAAARRIAEFVGLSRYRFIVSICRQEHGVGGQVELQPSGEDVFVEVSATLQQTPTTVLATLAHEITHKYLQVNGVSCGPGLNHRHEDEVLTDIASVWLGLGKLVLNGCESQATNVEETPNGTRTTTTSHRVGYLAMHDFAFVYLLISTMRGVSSADYERGLTPAAMGALHHADRRYRHYLKNNWRSVDAANGIRSQLERAADEAQVSCAALRRDVTLLRKACVDSADTFLREAHAVLKSRLDALETRAAREHINPCLRFLYNLELDRMARTWEREFAAIATKARGRSGAFGTLLESVRKMGGEFPQLSREMFDTIVCPQDGTVQRVDALRSRFQVRCRMCRYEWVVETALPEPIEAKSPTDTQRRRPSWLGKFVAALFGRENSA